MLASYAPVVFAEKASHEEFRIHQLCVGTLSFVRQIAASLNNYGVVDKRSGWTVSNSTAFAEVLSRVDAKFDLTYQKRAFFH